MLIAIEGLDGAGKSLLTNELLERLDGSWKIETMAYPDKESPIGKAIEQGIKDGACNEHMSALFERDRLERTPELKARLIRADIVILDRYLASGAAYQGNIGRVISREVGLFGMRVPDLSILVHSKDSSERAAAREGADNYDTDEYRQNMARAAYNVMKDRGLLSEKWITINTDNDMSRNVDDVVTEINRLMNAEAEVDDPSSCEVDLSWLP